ncbi:MAG: hypothetical protein E6377_18885 [Clostridium sp.]|nr:hypothetical protein [Clostridium sp.]MDU6937540.1 hypothetical protein [Clostridium sp.]
MKILRKIVVMSSVTGGKEVERYICNRCDECKRIIKQGRNGDI